MGRTVSYPQEALYVAIKDVSELNGPGDWEYFIDDIKESAKAKWPSLYDTDKWLDREDHAILKNDHVFIGVSEYGGWASVWIVPRDDIERPELAVNWAHQIGGDFMDTFAEYVRSGPWTLAKYHRSEPKPKSPRKARAPSPSRGRGWRRKRM